MTAPNDPTGGLSSLELIDPPTTITVVPERGALVTSWSVQGRELLYIDAATLTDLTKNVRGGVPVLFPSPGKLTDDRWTRGGRGGALKQHGFARNLAWRVDDKGPGEVTLGLGASEATRAGYPFEFAARLRYVARGSTLAVTMTVRNEGTETMPFGAGFHPYFQVPVADKATTRVHTDATRAFDNVSKREVPYALDLTAGEVDLHLLDHHGTSAAMTWSAGTLTIEGSAEFTRWVIWTLPGKDFICLEPWTCPADALNTGRGLIELAPGDERELRVDFRFEPA